MSVTTVWSLVLLSVGACGVPIGPDQQEAGLEKSGPDQRGALPRSPDMTDPQRESPAPVENPGTRKQAVVDAYLRCFDSCADASQQSICHNDCALEVSAGSGEINASACPRSCVKAFGACLAPCGDTRSAEQLVTCRKQCRVLAEDCVDGCD